ncbi:thioredoxin family protein [Planococcus sp. N028]|uniref:Thioredoxin family protein n=1 Tax=Planococcus shixiaomingii TaxID=3058393 RepID=A0ABT8MY20_9BACL|nr:MULTISPECIES: thioredoxin family protein [unclassified Planococcus (in: firmicutes)]MDN7240540.1 thioredoxin family protein [Planococcus sp. N028]WKA56433.1 thioredoxin family protein [Planococcus sp. N022]
MKAISSMQEYQEKIDQRESFLLFVKTDNCSVCEGLRPQVESFEKAYRLPFFMANAARLPELAGSLLLFTAPVVLLFHEGKEIHRFARFVPIEELRRKLDEMEEGLNV